MSSLDIPHVSTEKNNVTQSKETLLTVIKKFDKLFLLIHFVV